MFMVFSKDKIISYLVSIGTVALLFVISFADDADQQPVIKVDKEEVKEFDLALRKNIIRVNECIENVIINETAINSIENSLSNTLKNK